MATGGDTLGQNRGPPRATCGYIATARDKEAVAAAVGSHEQSSRLWFHRLTRCKICCKTVDTRGVTRSNVAHEIAGSVLAWSQLEHCGTRWSTL